MILCVSLYIVTWWIKIFHMLILSGGFLHDESERFHTNQ